MERTFQQNSSFGTSTYAKTWVTMLRGKEASK